MDGIPHFESRSLLRLEDLRLVTGAGRYVADLAPPGTIHLAFVRSAEAHARITAIDSTAVDRAGVVGVFTAEDLNLADIPGDSIATAAPGFPRPHLAHEKVRYVGEPIAVVAATPFAAAVDAADLVWMDYEPLPAVIDPRSSAEDRVLIHEAAGTNVVHRSDLEFGEFSDDYEVVAEIAVTNQRLAPNPIEPLVILAQPEVDGRLTVYISHQRPHGVQARLSQLIPMAPPTSGTTTRSLAGPSG